MIAENPRDVLFFCLVMLGLVLVFLAALFKYDAWKRKGKQHA